MDFLALSSILRLSQKTTTRLRGNPRDWSECSGLAGMLCLLLSRYSGQLDSSGGGVFSFSSV